MQLIDGRKIAQGILDQIKSEVEKLSFQPVFCDVLVGNDPASAQYVAMKGRAAERVGIKFREANFPANISTEDLVMKIKKLGKEQNMCGLIVQLPLPASLDKQKVLNSIDSKIDVDSTGQVNTDLFYAGKAYVEFPTAAAVMEGLDFAARDAFFSPSRPSSSASESEWRDMLCKEFYKSKKFLVIGYGQLVGKPVEFLLKQRGARVDVARSKTENIAQLMKEADVIISATGKAKLVSGDKIKFGAIIIDAGTSESGGGIVGDVDFESVKDVASYVSPVPGGVGPVTVAKLLQNVVKVAKNMK